MREGLKWSDGVPYTADDIVFWWNDIVRWKGWPTPPPAEMKSVTKVDDYTVRFDFEKPFPNFMYATRGFAGGERGGDGINGTHERSPAHYMKKFHPDYTPMPGMSPQAQMQRLADKNKAARIPYMEDPKKPVIWPWMPVEYREAQYLRMERNPYFWTVDREGNQLPYIDTVESELIYDSDKELIKLKLISGEAHFEQRSMRSTDVPLLAQSPHLDMTKTIATYGAEQGIYVNYNHPDPVKRELYRNPNFRRALSIAIDRKLINETAHMGQGRPGMGMSPPGAYDEKVDGRWTFFDTKKANAMLDECGLSKKDNEGYRLLPNGARFDFTLLFVPNWAEGATETAEIATQNWREVGIRANAHAGTEVSIALRRQNEDFDANERCVFGGLMILDWFPRQDHYAMSQWEWWNSRSTPKPKGVEPTGPMRRLFEIKDEIDAKNTGDNPQVIEKLMQELREIYADQMFGFGIVQDVRHPVPVAKKLRNVWGRKVPLILHFGEEEINFRAWYFAN